MADLKRTTELWLAKSDSDLRTAQVLLQLQSEHFESIVFHCQQSAEKSIKAYLAFFKIRFTKTHDIQKLLDLVATNDQTLADELRPSESLTIYATAYRYPEEVEVPAPLSRTIADNIYQLTKTVSESLKSKIGLR